MNNSFKLFAGPVQLDSLDMAVKLASKLNKICKKSNTEYVFRTTLNRDNRINYHSQNGLDILDIKQIINYIRNEYKIPVCVDVNTVNDILMLSGEVDYIELSSFHCNQDEFIAALTKTKSYIIIKKDIFQSLEDFLKCLERLKDNGVNFMITDEGTVFGYGNVVIDNIILAKLMEDGYLVNVDVTRCVDVPSAISVAKYDATQYLGSMLRAVCGVCVNAVSMYIYNNSDYNFRKGPNLLILDSLDKILTDCQKIRSIINQ